MPKPALKTPTRPPREPLGTAGALIDTLVKENGICSAADLILIDRARAALQQAHAAEATLRRRGQTYETRTGRTLPRPEVAISKAANAELHRCLVGLALASPEPAKPKGRPAYLPGAVDVLKKIGSPHG